MTNGFQGSHEEWRKKEAPYLLIDPILRSFAEQHNLTLEKNSHDADRCLRWDDGVHQLIWIHTAMYGESGYSVAVVAYQDRGAQRYSKDATIGNGVGMGELNQTLELAWETLASWSENELDLEKDVDLSIGW